MPTHHIHIEGQVQGVGFRPYVYRLARQHGLNGWVSNTTDGVHVEFNASREIAKQFYKALIRQAPAMSIITHHRIAEIPNKTFDDFEIVDSEVGGEAKLLLTPDFAMCEDCREELYIKNDRRFGYPFITCTNCGPRFSIVTQLPYDRERTTMAPFEMCLDCQAEYESPLNRRYYSQTNSCPACSIHLSLFHQEKGRLPNSQEAILHKVPRLWSEGRIIAIKGIGGFLLTCDATNADAILFLRSRKHRPDKPFALMYPSLDSIAQDAELSESAIEALQSPTAPIVLLPVKKKPASGIDLPGIAPELDQIGVMLPYAPLFDMLLKTFGKPIIATSGNLSGSPICYEEIDALDYLAPIADYILTHDRDIAAPQDDSVLRFSPFHDKRIILRRSRGMAPTFLPPTPAPQGQSLLAMGAEMKSAFTLMHAQNFYVSQFLGSLDEFESQERFRKMVYHLLGLFDAQPQAILVDQHPGYFSTQFGEELARHWGIPLQTVQHHEAHFAAVLGEHGLLHPESPILGVIWDGLGLGQDGQAWGGEFFRYNGQSFERLVYFDYFSYVLGDKTAREPRLSALMATAGLPEAGIELLPKFSKTEWDVYQKMLESGNGMQSSSVGRLFDAAASLLIGRDKCTFEGEAAMQLEKLATDYCLRNGLAMKESYPIWKKNAPTLSTRQLMAGILAGLKAGQDKGYIAACFHWSLAMAIRPVAEAAGVRKIAFSGGVWQNALLVDMVIELLGKDFELYFHRELSPNDENIAFGQLCHSFIVA
ncbi:MAG: carbamoyltransferase HypF [Phaeodactylibacter sp.]|nr:carbamoyltransferase HypF [Phaeodactylibacter sp.]